MIMITIIITITIHWLTQGDSTTRFRFATKTLEEKAKLMIEFKQPTIRSKDQLLQGMFITRIG